MSSATEDIQIALMKLTEAQEKINELEDEIESLKAKTAAGLAVNKSLVAEIRSISEDRDMWKQSRDNAHKAFGALQDVVLGKGSTTETYDDLLAPVQELVNFKETVRSCLSMDYDSSCGKLAYELRRALNPGSTEERDSILSEIRKVLGAKDRNEDRPHETALQAAKRVMEELNQRKENEKRLHREIENIKEIRRLDSQQYKAQYESDQANLRSSQQQVKELENIISYSYQQKTMNENNSLKEKVGLLEEQIKEQARENAILRGQRGARTYNPPHGHMVIRTEDFTQLFKDSEDLKIIKEKLGLT